MSETGDQPSAPVSNTRERVLTVLALSFCVVVALGLRAWALWRRGLVDFDETYYYILGRNLITGKGYVLNGLRHTAFPPLYPIFVGLTSLFTDNMRLATSLVSAVAGALLPVPVYFLAKDIHGRKAALLAAAAAAVWRGLFFFAAANVYYARRLYFGSEPLYMTLVACGMLFTWRLARAGGWRDAIAAGAFFALASLTRNEGPVVFAFLFVWLVLDSALTRNLLRRQRLARIGIVAAAMAVVFSPFLVYVRAVTGTWSLGAKLDNNARIRATLWDWVERSDNSRFMRVHYALNADNTELEDPYWGVSPWHARIAAGGGAAGSGAALVFDPDWRWLKVYTDIFWNVARPLVPRYAWALVILGLLTPPWNAVRLRWWLFSAFAFLAMALLAVSLYALPRHELPLLTLFAVAAGKGLTVLTDLFRRAVVELLNAKGALAWGLSLLPALVFFLVMADSGARLNGAGNRRTGKTVDMALALQASDARLARLLRAELPPGSTLMCNQPWLALWAGMEWRVSPFTEPARLAEYARTKGIDYAVLYPWQLSLASNQENAAAVIETYAIGRMRFGADLWVLDFRRPERPGVKLPDAAARQQRD